MKSERSGGIKLDIEIRLWIILPRRCVMNLLVMLGFGAILVFAIWILSGLLFRQPPEQGGPHTA